MSRGIQNVDAVSFIFKLQNGRGYRDTSFFFNLHPVRNRMLCCCLSFYTSRLIDGTSVQQEFFSQSRLSCIRMGNDCKRSSLFYFAFNVCHCIFLSHFRSFFIFAVFLTFLCGQIFCSSAGYLLSYSDRILS